MNTKDIQIYYLFRCDDLKRPSYLLPDTSFNLSDYDKVFEIKNDLDSLGIRYDLLIERFDDKTASVLSNDYIVDNNYLNH